MLEQHVFTRDTDVSSTQLNVSGYIRSANNHQLYVGQVSIKQQLTAFTQVFSGRYARVRE